MFKKVSEAYASTAKNTVSGPQLIVKLYERLTLDIETARFSGVVSAYSANVGK